MRKAIFVLGILAALYFVSTCKTTASVEVVNHYTSAVISLTITPSSASSPDPDLLKGDSIPSGSSRTFRGFAPGTYIMQAIFADLAMSLTVEYLSAGETYSWVLD